VRADPIRLLGDRLTSVALAAVAALAGVLLFLPTVVVILASFTSTAYLSFPPSGFSLRWYERLLASDEILRAARTSLVVAALATLGALASVAVIAVSVLLGPDLWAQFIEFAVRNGNFANPPMPLFPVSIPVRIATGLALLLWGARTNRRWTVPVACGWALPALYGLGFLPFWIAALRLIDRRDEPGAEASTDVDR